MKKNLILFIIANVLLWNCTSVPKPVMYKVKGKLLSNYEGKEAVLSVIDKNMSRKAVDTVVVKDSIFEFTVAKQNPQVAIIQIDKNLIPVIIGDGDIVIELNPFSVFLSNISQTTSLLTKKFFDYEKHAMEDKQEGMSILQKLRASKNPQKQDSLKKDYDLWRKNAEQYQYDYINHNKDVVGLIIMQTLLSSQDADFKKIRDAFESYPPEVRTTNFGKYINTVLLTRGATEIGGKAPNFVGTTPDGKKLSLNQAMGKVTIIDFWASWCRPCRMENPYVVEIYNKYHDQGLNIIGVSLDKNKKAWLQAIENDGLKWQHVSELKFWQDPIAKIYGVTAIPQTFILDAKGIIRAKNLRRKQLEDKVKELINE